MVYKGVEDFHICAAVVMVASKNMGPIMVKIWRAGFSPVWTQVVATSSICYDVVTFPTQRTYSSSNFVANIFIGVRIIK